MKKYLSLVKRQTNQIFSVEFVQVSREENEHAYRLAKVTSTEHMTIGRQVLSSTQHFPTTKELEYKLYQQVLIGRF